VTRRRSNCTKATAAAATGQLGAVMGELAAQFPETNGRIGGELRPFWKATRGPQMMFVTALALLQGVMLLVLLAIQMFLDGVTQFWLGLAASRPLT